MIIQALINLVITVFGILTAPISIPNMPQAVKDILSTALEYMATGMKIVGNFVDMPTLLLLFSIILAVDVGMFLFKFIMWVIKKIPFLGIS